MFARKQIDVNEGRDSHNYTYQKKGSWLFSKDRVYQDDRAGGMKIFLDYH